MASATASTVCPRERNSYFRRSPREWNLDDYLRYHKDDPNPSTILARWKSTLSNIPRCRPSCCGAECRKRATALHNKWHKKGPQSDRRCAKRWLEKQQARQSNASDVTTINYGSIVVNSTVSGTVQGAAETTDEALFSDDSLFGSDEIPPTPESGESCDPEDAIRSSFASFDEARKWRLRSSKRAVEDVLFETYCHAEPDDKTFPRGLVRNWTIDLGNEIMKTWFDADEWEEICSSVPSLPKPTAQFGRSLARFHKVKTTADLRNVLNTTSYLPPGMEYDPAEHFDLEWADNVLRQFLPLFEATGSPLRQPHLEGWYTTHLWSLLLDKCLLSLPYITLERNEAACRATALRKNRTRTDSTTRSRSAPHLDGIIRSVQDVPHEYGGMEVIKTFHGSTTSTKWLNDDQKLVKALRDMFDRQHELVDHDPILVKQLQLVGFVTGGLVLSISRLCHPNGYVCVLQREGRQEVPTEVKQLKQLLLLVTKVVQVKAVIKGCIDAIESRSQVSSEEGLFEEIMNAGTARKSSTLPPAADSP